MTAWIILFNFCFASYSVCCWGCHIYSWRHTLWYCKGMLRTRTSRSAHEGTYSCIYIILKSKTCKPAVKTLKEHVDLVNIARESKFKYMGLKFILICKGIILRGCSFAVGSAQALWSHIPRRTVANPEPWRVQLFLCLHESANKTIRYSVVLYRKYSMCRILRDFQSVGG